MCNRVKKGAMQQAEFTQRFGELTPKPRSVLILMVEGKSDEEIAREIGASEATVRKHIQNLCDHFAVAAEVDGIRKNRRQELLRLSTQYLAETIGNRTASHTPPTEVEESVRISNERQDWGSAPDVSVFYGREEELNTLKRWVLAEDCRLVTLLGMAGMGKTTLAVKLAQETQSQFDYVIWRSLQNATPLKQLLADLILLLNPLAKPRSDNITQNISLLLAGLREFRRLIILDDFDTLLRRGDFAGHYQDAYQDYRQLLKRLGEEPHQSCVILTTLEKPREIALLEGETLPVRTLQVEGLGRAAKEILKAKGLTAENRWSVLIKLYRGNPLALKMVASTISELFGGNVSDFLDMSLTGIVQDIILLVGQQFERLSSLEKRLLYWLALTGNPLSLIELRSLVRVPELELFTTLKSLGERSLIEKSSGKFSLQPVVREYVKTYFVEQVYQEIEEVSQTQAIEHFNLLRHYTLTPSQPALNDPSIRSIFSLFYEQLFMAQSIQNTDYFIQKLELILKQLNELSSPELGYVEPNLKTLIEQLQENP